MRLFQVLSHYNGKCENLELTLVLMSENKQVGELITFMDGLNVDLRQYPPREAIANGVTEAPAVCSSPTGYYLKITNRLELVVEV